MMQMQRQDIGASQRASRPPETETAALQRALRGDPLGFEWIMRRHNRRLYRLARASLGDETEAKDALQEAYVAAFRRLGQFRGEAALGTWLARIVLNECVSRQRRALRRDKVVPMISMESHPEAMMQLADDTEPPESALARAQIKALLEAGINALPESLRLVFVLRSVEELSVAETAEHLGISQENVRARHLRARGLLRQSLTAVLESAQRELYPFGGCDCDAVIAAVLSRLPHRP